MSVITTYKDTDPGIAKYALGAMKNLVLDGDNSLKVGELGFCTGEPMGYSHVLERQICTQLTPDCAAEAWLIITMWLLLYDS